MSPEKKAPIQTATLAEIYFKQGFYQKARRVYAGILQEDPHNLDAQSRLHEIDQLIDAPSSSVEMLGQELKSSEDPVLQRLNRWLTVIQKRRAHV